ncbi:MAG TPA: type I methionyl aminopeptidase [Leptospiraceae bacterium]|nr:type I methionyl aminopeptidase [Leptospiraceae bacterium]
MIEIKSQQEIEKMRAAGKLAAETLLAVGEFIKPGITGLDIDRFVKEFTEKNGGTCAPYMYKNSYSEKHPFPGHVCISPNNVVCHGIPNNKPLDNTIFNVDITCILDGAHGDTSAMFFLGKVSDEDIFLMKTAQDALMMGIMTISNGTRVGDIGEIIQTYSEQRGFSIVKEFGGHGIGIGPNGFHMKPDILHYGKKGLGQRLLSGLTHTVEPMLNAGDSGIFLDKNDLWTVYTKDGKNSAQWEHTILVTDFGSEILTYREAPLKNSVEILTEFS